MEITQFKSLLRETINKANEKSPREIGTLGHLMIYCLQKNFRYRKNNSSLDKVIKEIDKAIKKYAIIPPNNSQSLTSYDIDKAVDNYSSFFASRNSQKLLTDNILFWLLEGDFQDKMLIFCRRECNCQGIDLLYLMPQFSEENNIELGFGIEINSNWLGIETDIPLVGRDGDISKHLGFLSLSILQRRHYLLEGHQGVGKSSFIQQLLYSAATRWQNSTDTLLRNVRFILFQQGDFIYSEEDNRTRLTRLYEYLRTHPQVIPAFDGVEGLLNPVLSVQEDFIRLFGSILTNGGRTFILVCRTGGVLNSNLLQPIPTYNLPPLSPKATFHIVYQKMEQRLSEVSIALGFENSMEEFCESLINLASERYPGRFFPEIGLHLVESVINRAITRIIYLKQKPLDKITLSDLWEHIAEELNLNSEVFGKNPEEFYQQVKIKLKENVIAQDWAINRVCEVLYMMTTMPSRKAPRGKFLFVGPPGVGKTHLGRQLAIHLGLGDEAFFVFNMAEYSTDSARTRFMGADPGYVGYRATPTIYDRVRSRPSCVILLDEIDRAHASIQDILLSILEGEGRDSEGNIVYFSQVIFIMTTNQGQEQVEEAYKQVIDGSITRHKLGNQFSNESFLRKLILQGAIDESGVEMRQFLQDKIDALKNEFDYWWKNAEQESNSSDNINPELLINQYVNLQNLVNRIEYVQSKTPLDRAFLDRIDFVIPFFPIKEPQYLEQILNLILKSYRWDNCSPDIKENIITEALQQKQSVRCLERLVISERVKQFRI